MARRVFSTVTSASPGHLGETALVPEGIRGFAVESRVGTAFGKYNIVSLLGKGGMGEVYEAYDTDKNRTVALKILADGLSNDATFRERFQRESHAAAVLQEPHVIPIHDWGEIDGRLYIDMRLVRGQTLDELIAKGPLEPARAIAIIGQVAAALDAAHAEGLMHRDIKPHNVVVTEADFAYLVDFGIAEARGDTRLTTAGTPIGTVNYMAPERFNQQHATPAVDVYALACVLYESLTGDSPFARDSLENLVAAHLVSPPPRPSVTNPRVLRRRSTRSLPEAWPRTPMIGTGPPAAWCARRTGLWKSPPADLAAARRGRRRNCFAFGRGRCGHRPAHPAEGRACAAVPAGDRARPDRPK
jgi:serine/threonine protein kinase